MARSAVGLEREREQEWGPDRGFSRAAGGGSGPWGELGRDGADLLPGASGRHRLFQSVNDFIKLPAKYRLTSRQVITIMWEVTAQLGYRDCSGVHLLSTRAGQPLPLPAVWEHGPTVPSSAQGDRALLHQGHGAASQAPPATAISPQGAKRGRAAGIQSTQHILPEGPGHSPLPEGLGPELGSH